MFLLCSVKIIVSYGMTPLSWASEPLRLLLQEPPQSADDLDLHWKISYTDTVMGDRQVFILGSKQ